MCCRKKYKNDRHSCSTQLLKRSEKPELDAQLVAEGVAQQLEKELCIVEQ